MEESPGIAVFPNPASDRVNFDSGASENEIRNISIFNAMGQSLATPAIEQNQIDISGLPDGLYFIHLEFEDKRLIRKVIKQ
jgi:hypothetical protein